MRGLIIFAVLFALLYLFFRKMMVWMHVSMTGWEFIVFIIVLAGMAEYVMYRMKPR